MGYHADDAHNEQRKIDMAQEFDELEADRIRDEYASGRLKWTSANKEEILIIDMKNDHLNNTLKFLKRQSNPSYATAAWIEVLEKEQNRRLKFRT